MKKYKHSGPYGDLVYSLPLVKHFGGGEFYVHLEQYDWIAKHYYGARPAPIHQGGMTIKEYQSLEPLLAAQTYITKVATFDPACEITHNLDRFRPLFVGHPTNYIDIYCQTFGIVDPEIQRQIRHTAWLTVPNIRSIPGRPWVINRTERWITSRPSSQWKLWQEQGQDQHAVFVGLPREFELFQKATGWQGTEYCPTANLLELAEVIAGSEVFVGNQSVALSIALGLGKKVRCELRQDLPRNRNECYFPDQPGVEYF